MENKQRPNAKKRKHRISTIVAICFLSILIAQFLIIVMNFMLFRTDDKLNKNSYSFYLQKADTISKDIERAMVDLWSNERHLESISRAMRVKYFAHLAEQTEPAFDSDLAEMLINTLHAMKVSGAFAVFNSVDPSHNIRQVLHFKDTNHNTLYSKKSELIMATGDAAIAHQLGTPLSSDWSPFIHSTHDSIYMKAMSLAEQQARSNNFQGFWLSPACTEPLEERSIYYIQPLVHPKTHEVYGIIGTEVNLFMINDLFHYSTISESGAGELLLVSSIYDKEGHSQWDVITAKGPLLQRYVSDYSFVAQKKYNPYYDTNYSVKDNLYIYEINLPNGKQLVGIQRQVRLATADLEKYSKLWYLIAVIDRDDIEAHAKSLISSLTQLLFISLLMGLFVIVIVTRLITHPFHSLTKSIEKLFNDSSLENSIEHIEPLNIVEIDELTDTIEKLSVQLIRNSRKFRKIFETADVPFVAIETNFNDKAVYKLGKISKILPGCIENEQEEVVLDIEYYQNWVRDFLDHCERIESNYNPLTRTQSEIIKKVWKDKTYYLKTITKSVDNYDLNVDNLTTYASQEQNPVILQILMDRTDEVEEQLKIKQERDLDPLTGLLNHFSFEETVSGYLKANSQLNLKAAMVMWDLDNLKYVNDTYGHDHGDKYLQLAGDMLRELQDEGAIVARVSGDEFFAFIPYTTNPLDVRAKVSRIHSKLFDSVHEITETTKIRMRATAGITWYPEDASDYKELRKFADFAMYTAKHTRKGSICEFNRTLFEKNYILFSGKEDLHRLIEEKQVRFAFQPIVCTRTGEVFGYEALMRSSSKNINSVSDILRLATAQSRLVDIEKLTFSEVLRIYEHKLEQFGDRHLFINSIPNVTIQADDLHLLLDQYGGHFQKVIVELIENEVADDDAMEVKKFVRRKYNCKLAVDDYGTGYATDSQLLIVNPDFVKVDMTLIRNIHQDKERQTMLENIVRYCKEHHIKVIAEGIENASELAVVIPMGVDFVQGYYIGIPKYDIEDIEEDKKSEIIYLGGVHAKKK